MIDKIIKYDAGEMSPDEMRTFGEELKSSKTLESELIAYREFVAGVHQLREIETDDRYFNGIIPEFRSKQEAGKKRGYHPVFSFVSAIAAVVILFLILPVHNVQNVINLENNVSSTEISEYLSNYNDQQVLNTMPGDFSENYDSLVGGILYNQLGEELGVNATTSVFNSIDYTALVKSIDKKEADQIYSAMINKKIF